MRRRRVTSKAMMSTKLVDELEEVMQGGEREVGQILSRHEEVKTGW